MEAQLAGSEFFIALRTWAQHFGSWRRFYFRAHPASSFFEDFFVGELAQGGLLSHAGILPRDDLFAVQAKVGETEDGDGDDGKGSDDLADNGVEDGCWHVGFLCCTLL